MRKPKTQPSDLFTRTCNAELHADCVREYRFFKPRMWRFDYAIPLYKIAVEVEGGVWTGGRHIRPKGFLGDMQKYNTATLCGWRVFRTTPQNLMSSDFFKLLRFAINAVPISSAESLLEDSHIV